MQLRQVSAPWLVLRTLLQIKTDSLATVSGVGTLLQPIRPALHVSNMADDILTLESEVAAALKALEIECTDQSLFTGDNKFLEVACTLAEEVDAAQAFSYNPSSTEDIWPRLREVLSRLGYEDSFDNRVSILEFLVAETYACRIAAHTEPGITANSEASLSNENVESDSPADVSIATSISRLCTALDVSADETAHVETCEHLNYVASLLAGKISDAVVAGTSLGARLIPPRTVQSLTEAQLRECETISSILDGEHSLRKGLLMTRLDVTVQSFGYSDKASPDAFQSILRGLRNVVQSSEQPIEVYDALVARDWLLNLESVSKGSESGSVASQVKRLLMGSVPDRGGRIGAAAKAMGQMPQFRPRISGQDNEGRKGRQRSHGRSRRK